MIEEGATSSKNWMLDQVRKTCEMGLSQEELIKRLTIEKIEYGRVCLHDMYVNTLNKSAGEMGNHVGELDAKLRKKIGELGGKAIPIRIVIKSKKS